MTFSAAAGCPLSVDSISRIAKVSETPTEYAEAFFFDVNVYAYARFQFFGVSMRLTIDFWSYITIFKTCTPYSYTNDSLAVSVVRYKLCDALAFADQDRMSFDDRFYA